MDAALSEGGVAEEVREENYPLYLVPRALVPELEALGFRLGTYFGDLREVCPWTSRPPLGHREGCSRIPTADVGTEE